MDPHSLLEHDDSIGWLPSLAAARKHFLLERKEKELHRSSVFIMLVLMDFYLSFIQFKRKTCIQKALEVFWFSTSAPIGILVDSDWQADVVIQSLAQLEVTSTFQTLSMGSRINRINPAKINPKDFFFFFLKFAHSSSSPLTLRIWDVCGLTSATKLSKLVF